MSGVPRGAMFEQIDHWNSIGRHDLALERVREALRESPDDVDLLVQASVAYSGLGDRDAARDAVASALRAAPDHPIAHFVAAQIATEEGGNREAEEHLLAALAVSPENPRLLLAYAGLMHRTGHLEKSERLVRAALAQDPDDADAHSLLTLILAEHRGASAEGAAHGRLGVGLEPEGHFSHLALGLHEYEHGRPFVARRHLREALRLDPTDAATESAFVQADYATRWIYLPFYYWSLLVNRIPGKQFAVWGAFLVFSFVSRQGPLVALRVPVLFAYLGFMIYTWLATPLVKLWVKWRPAT